jgi:uncharacterized protein YyaL (SSP411 family)
MLKQVAPFYEIAIVGTDALEKSMDLQENYQPNSLILGSDKESDLSLLKNKMIAGQTTIYICQNKSCRLPTTDVKQAFELMP